MCDFRKQRIMRGFLNFLQTAEIYDCKKLWEWETEIFLLGLDLYHFVPRDLRDFTELSSFLSQMLNLEL